MRCVCPVCRFYRMHINTDGQSSVEAARNGVLRSSHFCTHPDVVREKGDGVNPVPIDLDLIRIANERYRSVPRQGKWNRTPREFAMTDNLTDPTHVVKVLDSERDEVRSRVWENSAPIQEKMRELGIVDFSKATPEQRAEILGLIEFGVDDRVWYAPKIDIYNWIYQQLWDKGCDKGARRIDPNDPTDVGMKVKVRII